MIAVAVCSKTVLFVSELAVVILVESSGGFSVAWLEGSCFAYHMH